MRPRNCETCGKVEELRPYGAGGAWVCFSCAMATPESKAEAERRFMAKFEQHNGLVVLDGGPPRGATYEEAVLVEDVLDQAGKK